MKQSRPKQIRYGWPHTLPKIWRMMKLATFLLFISCLQVSATAYSQRNDITLSLQGVSLEQAFSAIRQQSGYLFLYNNEKLAGTQEKISVHLKDATIDEVMKACLKGLPLSYLIMDKTVVITPDPLSKNALLPRPGEFPADREITGVVTDDAGGQPLAGVTIRVKGEDVGTITDAQGKFKLEVPDGAVIEVSYLGYASKEIPADGKTIFNISLAATATGLNQLVVIGYGTKLKASDLTGSIAKLNGDKLESRPVTGTLDALQGLIPGVNITRQNGQPGQQGYKLAIRGTSSINGNVPLVLIDGVPGDLSLINPEDIQDITVLKDATAAIYGARAADGVILVTTKRGKASQSPQVSYSFNLAVKKIGFIKKATSTDHFVRMFNEANKNDGDPQTFSDETLAKIAANDPGEGKGENWSLQSYPMFYQSRDWYGSLFKTVLRPTHNVSVSGGGKNSTYLVSFGDTRDNGNIAVGNNSSVRDNLRINLHIDLLKNLKLDGNISYDYLNTKQPSELNDAIDNGLKVFSYVPVKNPAGNYYGYQGYENPFQELLMGGSEDITDSRWNNNFKLSWEPITGLTWTGQLGINLEQFKDDANFPTNAEHNWDNSINSLVRNNPNSATYRNWNSVYKIYSTYLNYDKTFGKHELMAMIGASSEKFTRQSEYMSGADFTSNDIFPLPLSDPKNLSAGDYWDNNPWALLSYFGRVSYSFAGKYYLEGTMRKDGSSKFSPEKRWSEIYPSISAAWKISEEPFFKNHISDNIVNLFKVRASWGRTGNQDIPALGLFDYIQLISIGGQYPIDGSTISKMASLNGIASPERTWETIETKNLGLDLVLFRSRLALSFDIYRKNNRNMLVSVAYPATLGATAPTSNAGSLLDKGWEFTGSWNSEIGKVHFNVGVILNYNSNIVTNLQGQDTYNLGLTTARQGYPLNSYFGYKGSVIRTQAALDAYASKYAGKGIVPATQPNGYGGLGIGDVMYQDMDGDGQITTYGDKSKGYSGDAVFLGSQDPKLTYSMTGGLSYNNIDFSFILQGTGNKYVWRGNGNFGVPLGQFWFQPLDYFYGKTFTKDNTNAQYPRLSNNATVKSNNYQFSSLWLENTRYLRVKNITIGYTFKNIQLSKLKLHNLRIYFSGQDVFELAKGTWGNTYDPEESNPDPNNYAYYENNYPMYRTFSFGANVNF